MDSHVIPLIDEKWAHEENPIRYIADKRGNILYKICGKFFMFAKSGALVCEVEIEDGDDLRTIKHMALSPNGRYLVYEIKSEEVAEMRI